MKTNDIVLASFPKSGVTYLAFLLTTARLHHNGKQMRPSFFNIDWLAIDEGKMGKTPRPEIWFDGMGDFIKTHSPAALTRDSSQNVIFLLRNPVDTLRSYYFFRKQLGNKDTPRAFLDGQQGIKAWLEHINSWVINNESASQSLYVVQYEQLVSRPAYELDNILFQLGLKVEEESLAEAEDWSSQENMRVLEKHFFAHNPVYQKYNLEFVREGKQREVAGFEELRPYITEKTAAAYAAVKSKLPV